MYLCIEFKQFYLIFCFFVTEDKPLNTSDGRIKFENDKDVLNAYLIIENVQMSDRNHYTCKASNLATQTTTGTEKTTFVRVKGNVNFNC